jgi:hypothetical protein
LQTISTNRENLHMSQKRQATQRKSPQKKGNNRQNDSSNGNGSKAPRNRGPTRANGGQQRQVGAMQNYATGQIGKAPVIKMTGKSCSVTHRELIRNISSLNGTGAFVVNESLPLNPGLSSVFPWLSRIARNWESYRFKKLRFCGFTRTSTTTVGSIILAPDYDASDPAPSTEVQASSYADVVEDAPWKDLVCTLKPQSMFSNGPHKFVRGGVLQPNQDVKLYDVGNLHICTVDSTGAAAWQKLWVEYEVEFFTPQISTDQSDGSEKQVSSAGMTGAKPFGTSALVVTTSGEAIASWSDVAAGTFTLLRDYEGIIKMNFVGTVITAVAAAGGTATLTNLSRLFDGAGGLSAEFTSTLVGQKGQTFVCPVITATTITSSTLRISSYDTSVLA